MENALFYTFSTVAQALAGTLALLAAFALYKLQSFENELRENAVSAIQPFATDATLLAHAAHGRYAELLAAIDAHLGGQALHPTYNHWQAGHVERMRHVVSRKATLVTWLWRAIAITLLTMLAAVVALTRVPQLNCSLAVANSALAVAALLFGLCLATYVPLLRSFLR